MVSTNGPRVAEESVPEKRERRRREHRLERHRQTSNHDRLINEFQPDAVELERRTMPAAAWMTLYTVAALIVATIVWASWAEVDRIVTAQGKLVSVDAPILIDSKLATPIASLNAKFGDRVQAGMVIATMDPTFSDADVAQLEVRKASLDAVIARLRAEREDLSFDIAGHEGDRDWTMQLQLYQDRKREFEAQIKKYDAQLAALDVQLDNSRRETENNFDTYEQYSEYTKEIKLLRAKGSVSKLQVLQWDLQTKQAKQDVLSGSSRGKELLKSMESTAAERNAFRASKKTEIVTELVKATDELKSIEQDTIKANRQNQFVELRVPDDLAYDEFVVLEVTENSVGTVMQPGDPLYKLIPVGVDIEVEVEIEGKDIARLVSATEQERESGELPPGSDVRVKLSSFPYQKHGALDGAIRTISEGSFEKKLPGGVESGVTMYKARIALEKPYTLEEVGKDFRLMPGMTATAEIKVGHRKVIEYFLYPLIRSTEALREP
jgi:HlyD family secretion protein